MDVNKQLLDAAMSVRDGLRTKANNNPMVKRSTLEMFAEELQQAISTSEQAESSPTSVDFIKSVLTCEIEADVFERHVVPALEVAKKAAAQQVQQADIVYPISQHADPVARDVMIKAINEAIYECRYYGYDAGGVFQGWPEVLAEKIADRYAAQPPAVAAPDGYALVPVEPTKAMCEAGDRADADMLTVQLIYRAMIDAAPKT